MFHKSEQDKGLLVLDVEYVLKLKFSSWGA